MLDLDTSYVSFKMSKSGRLHSGSPVAATPMCVVCDSRARKQTRYEYEEALEGVKPLA